MKTSTTKHIIVTAAVTLCLCLMPACHHDHDHEHHHEHEHEHHHDHDSHDHDHEGEAGQSITLYTNGYELYAETTPPIAGEDMTVTTHLTRLADFKPVTDSVVEMRIGSESPLTSELWQGTKGIYRFTARPAHSGLTTLTWRLADGTEITFDSLQVYDDDESFDASRHHSEAKANTVKFTKEQSWACDFATAVVHPSAAGRVIEATAQVVSSTGDEQVAASRAAGVVRFAGNDIVEGATVSKGQRLFSIESSGLADGNMAVRYSEAEAAYTLAKSEYERKEDLAKKGVVSRAELERSRAAYTTARAAYDNLKGNFTPSGVVVTAPMSGYVKSVNVKNGDYVSAGQPVVTISQNKELFLRADLSPRYYSSLSHIKTANIELADGSVCSLEELHGSLVNYGKGSSQGSPLIPVTFRLRNTSNLVAGCFVKIYIVCEADTEVLAVENSGIVEEMGNHFVFVQLTPEQFEKRLVTLGGSDGLKTVVTSGLQSGERVVVKGATMVKLAQGAAALDPHAGHVH